MFIDISASSEIYVIGGSGSQRVFRLSLNDDSDLASLPEVACLPCRSLEDASVVEDASVIIVNGGNAEMEDGSLHRDRVWMLDTKENKPVWLEGPRLNIPRRLHCSLRLGNKLFVCAGRGENGNEMSSIETISFPNILLRGSQWDLAIEEYPIKVKKKKDLLCKLTVYIYLFVWHLNTDTFT